MRTHLLPPFRRSVTPATAFWQKMCSSHSCTSSGQLSRLSASSAPVVSSAAPNSGVPRGAVVLRYSSEVPQAAQKPRRTPSELSNSRYELAGALPASRSAAVAVPSAAFHVHVICSSGSETEWPMRAPCHLRHWWHWQEMRCGRAG